MPAHTSISPTLDGFVSVAEAARMRGVSPETIRRRIRRGALPAVREGGAWLISPVDLERSVAGAPAGIPTDPREVARIEAWADRMAADAPPLGPGQRAVIVTLLRGAAA